MEWREALGLLLVDAHRNPEPFLPETFMGFAGLWSVEHRIALARELLRDTGMRLEGEPACPHYSVGCALSANPMGAKPDRRDLP